MILSSLRFFLALLKVSIRASISLRGAFLIECLFMLGGNMVFFAIWWVFFRAFQSVGGWHFHDMVALMAIATGSYGLSKICFGGIKELSRAIATGRLDPLMTQPQNLLLHLVGSKSYSKGWGQLLTAFILIGLSETAWSHLPLLLFFMINGCLIFGATGVIAHSLAFWMGSMEAVAKKYCDSVFLFVHYPVNIYSGFLQVLMFTVFPAGIIGYVPVEILRHFSWLYLACLIGSAIAFVAVAFFVFYRGLKRYESGNLFGV